MTLRRCENCDEPRILRDGLCHECEQDEREDTHCRTCGAFYDGYGDGYDGECPSCADKSDTSRGK